VAEGRSGLTAGRRGRRADPAGGGRCARRRRRLPSRPELA